MITIKYNIVITKLSTNIYTPVVHHAPDICQDKKNKKKINKTLKGPNISTPVMHYASDIWSDTKKYMKI